MNFSLNMVATRSLKRAVNSHKLGHDIGSPFVPFLVLAKRDRLLTIKKKCDRILLTKTKLDNAIKSTRKFHQQPIREENHDKPQKLHPQHYDRSDQSDRPSN